MDEHVPPERRDNLFEPLPGAHGAHGSFDARSRERSLQPRVTTHRSWLALAGPAALLAGFAGLAPEEGSQR